jgi:hypothetical protein
MRVDGGSFLIGVEIWRAVVSAQSRCPGWLPLGEPLSFGSVCVGVVLGFFFLHLGVYGWLSCPLGLGSGVGVGKLGSGGAWDGANRATD